MANIRKDGAFIYLNAKELAGKVNPARDAFKTRFVGSKFNKDTFEWEIPSNGIDENVVIQFLGTQGVQIDGGGNNAPANQQYQPQQGGYGQQGGHNNGGANNSVAKIWMLGDEICLKSPLMKGREDIKNLMKTIYPGTHWDKNHWKIPASANVSKEDVIIWFRQQWQIEFEIGGKDAIPNQSQQAVSQQPGGNGGLVQQNGQQIADTIVSINSGGAMITLSSAIESVKSSGQAVKLTLIP